MGNIRSWILANVEGFSEGDDVVITYTGTLENEEKPPVITAMEAAQ